MNKQTKKWIFELLDKETVGLNMKVKNAKSQLIFSYNDVAQILDEAEKKFKVREDYDKELDILDFRWGDKTEHSREVRVDMIIDFDKKGDIIGLEIMDFRQALKVSQKKIDRIFKLNERKKK